jgi:hypothetical protein
MDSNLTRRRHYRIVLRGELGDLFGFLFENMQMRRIAGMTVMTGEVTDQVHLIGLLEQSQELGLELVSVCQVEGPDRDAADPQAQPAGRTAESREPGIPAEMPEDSRYRG